MSFHSCESHKENKLESICNNCYLKSTQKNVCCFCLKTESFVDFDLDYCKVTEEYYHAFCLEIEKEAFGRKLYEPTMARKLYAGK